MRKLLILIVVIFIHSNSIGQTLRQEDLKGTYKPKGKFAKYISNSGEVYSIGDTLTIGTPSGTNGNFLHIQKMDIVGTIYIVRTEAINTNAVVKKIYATGNKRSGYKASFQTKGLTALDNYFFKLEDAIAAGEIKSKGMSSDEALAELKKAKDKLDLGLITQEEFNALRAELAPLIK